MASFQCRLSDGERVTCTISHVVTDHQTHLMLDPQTSGLSHHAAELMSFETLAFTWSSFPGFALLVASDGSWPEEEAATRKEGWSPGFAPLAVIAMSEGKYALKPYGAPCFLTAENGTGRIHHDRSVIADWELFRFDSEEPAKTSLIGDFASSFAELLRHLSEPSVLLSALLSMPPSFQPSLLELLCEMLTPSALAELASIFVTDFEATSGSTSHRCERLLAALPQGSWLRDGFRRLHEWRTGQSFSIQRAGAQYDFLGFQENTKKGSAYCVGARLLSEARRTIKPTKTLALLATARDEGVYLLEWIAHHRRIGVEQFFIYTNDLTDGSDLLLRRLAEAGEIVWINNSGASPVKINMQDKAYNHALMVLPEILDYRWCLVVDLDEMVLPDASVDYCLPPLLAAREREGAEAVAMSWRVYTSNGHLAWAPGLSAARFVETESHPLIKTAFRTHLFSGASAHHPTSRERAVVPYMTIDGESQKTGNLSDHDVNFAARPTSNASVCHYHVRSLEEYVWKFARGENDNSGVLKTKHFRYNNPGIFELFTSRFDTGGVQPGLVLAEDINRETRRLLRLPGVAEASKEVAQRFRTQVGAFVEQSAQIMKQDDRIALDVRERWCALVDEWRHLSRPD